MKSLTYCGMGLGTNHDAIKMAVYSVSMPAWQAWDAVMWCGDVMAEINSAETDKEAVAIEDRYGMDYADVADLQEWWMEIHEYAKAREGLAA